MHGGPVGLVSEINCDNQGAMALADHDTLHLRSKHIALRYHFVREHIVRQDIVLKFVPGVVNLADCLTKPQGQAQADGFVEEDGLWTAWVKLCLNNVWSCLLLVGT
jgi:hypothetical protein